MLVFVLFFTVTNAAIMMYGDCTVNHEEKAIGLPNSNYVKLTRIVEIDLKSKIC